MRDSSVFVTGKKRKMVKVNAIVNKPTKKPNA
jgi:hypothetical protein